MFADAFSYTAPPWQPPVQWMNGSGWLPMFTVTDALRRSQGEALHMLGCGAEECAYRVHKEGSGWRLRRYGDDEEGPVILIVAAPIKRPYIWDLIPSVSPLRSFLDQGFRTYLLEWTRPSLMTATARLADYADRAIGEAVDAVTSGSGGTKPVLIGHSLGGTLATIFASLHGERVLGLVLLSSPLCFAPGTSRFRDSLTALAPASLAGFAMVPGSLLTQLSALSAPEAFVWSRLADRVQTAGDSRASNVHARVERWALDEVALPGPLVDEILNWLYREDRFFQGALPVEKKTVGPSDLAVPTLAVVNEADDIVPTTAVMPFLDAAQGDHSRLLTYTEEAGVGLQHLGLLVGRKAQETMWPEIQSWIRERSTALPKSEVQ